MRKKILFAIGRLSVGGAEKLLVNQLPVVDRGKFEPYLLTLFPEKPSATFEEKIVLPDDYWKRLNFRSLFDLAAWTKLFIFLRKEKFDVAVTALFSANLIVRLAAIIMRVPVIIIHEHNIYEDKHRWQIWMDWILSKWTDKIITDSDAAKFFTVKQEKIPLEKFITMYAPSFVDKSKGRNPDLIRKDLELPKDAMVVLTISRLVPEKGHKYLIDAAKLVLEKFPNAYFLIVGWGPLEESLKSQVSSLKLEDRVLFPGLFLGKSDIENILPIADIFVDPSTRTDMPFVIMEALSFGKPVVSTTIGDIPIFVKNGETGFAVPPANSAELADKILILLRDGAARERMGKAGVEMVKSYTMENYERTFEKLILDFYNKKHAN
ncbi:MAG: glycosyltransferase [Candidatus Harrisonbacteria bacterium]|nr:glycosyltransferase [Candidatus Harrisonbacteria bacterium]